MIWWPFNFQVYETNLVIGVVTHQWSGDLSILDFEIDDVNGLVVTHQWSGYLSIHQL